MRLWKVRTWADITIETITLFGQRKKHSCYFTYKNKYIYAETKDEASNKYYDLFFNPVEDGYDKATLSIMKFDYATKSANMVWDLPFNQKIVHTNEYISVIEGPVKEPIDVVRHNSSADDFRDWLMYGDTTDNVSMDELPWIDK